MARRVLAWQCKYCGEIKKSETIAVRHELTCVKNPDARNCMVCAYSVGSENTRELLCQKGKTCSRAVSAKCEHFKRKKNVKQ